MTSAPCLIVTGFRAFPGVPANPSEEVLNRLARSGILPAGTRLRLLDTVYAQIAPTRDEIFTAPPRALLMLGYSGLAEGFKLERRASDICSPAFADAAGFRPAERLDPPDVRVNETLDFDALIEALRAENLPCVLSDDAGSYVCNHIYHTMLARIARHNLPTRALFLHIPAIAGTELADSSASAMELEDLLRGTAVIARWLVRG